MDFLKAEIERKRKHVKDVEHGKKFFKRGDLLEKEHKDYLEKYAEKHFLNSAKINVNTAEGPSTAQEDKKKVDDENDDLPRAEVIKRLRSRSQPITLFGENERQSRARLRRLEIEQPDMKEGWKNDLISAMKEVDHELVEEVVKGEMNDTGKHDVDMPDDEDLTWEKVETNACLLGNGDNPNRDCDILSQFFSYILKRWGKALNSRDELTKRSPEGKEAATKHKQTMEHLRPLQNMLQNHNVKADIREHLIKICRLIIIDRDYIKANNAYMEMAIGNAPWPVGVTRSGLHQRPGSAKAYVSNIAHVLNDETQRKYIQAIKRLMTLCQKYFPADPSKCVESKLIGAIMMKNMKDDDPVLGEQLWAPYEHITRIPGKRIRTKLIMAFDHWLHLDNEVLESIVRIVEILHNASLLVDDVEDHSVLRRGIPCAHEIYGMPRTINTSSYCMFYALHECIRLGKIEAVKVYTEEIMKLHEGQGKEIYWRDTFQCPTVSQYEKMVLQKTGGLMSLAVRLMQIYSNKSFNFTPLVEKIALYFQIRDDYINLSSTEYEKQKGFAEDITEGKFSFPIILALQTASKAGEMREDDELLS
uniref:Pre-mRNA-splicing factor 18 n=1 Tax=Syphacia muris TaxID=451379 RepID=A0A0N5AMF6_9BILA